MSNLSINFSRILESFRRHFIIRPGSFDILWKSLYFRRRLNRTQNIQVWLQFSSNLIILEFKFFNINSPSLFSPTLSRFSINRRVSNYSANSKIDSSEASRIISLQEQAFKTIVIKYLAKRSGISSIGFSNISMSTCVKALINSLAVLTSAFLFYSIQLIISLSDTSESTLFDKSPCFNCRMCFVISSCYLSSSWSTCKSFVRMRKSSTSSSSQEMKPYFYCY